MQSYLTYRRIGHAIEKQIRRDAEDSSQTSKASHSDEAWEEQQRTREDQPQEIGEDGLGSTRRGSEDPGSTREKEDFEDLASFRVGIPNQELSCGNVDVGGLQVSDAKRHIRSQRGRSGFGQALDGVTCRERTTAEGEGGPVFVVGWNDIHDPANPQNFRPLSKACAVIVVSLVAFSGTMASSIDSAVLPQAAEDFGVSEVVESLATALYLVGFGIGTLYAGPFSETFGRNPVYIGSLTILVIWLMASALAPNIGAQLTFRFLAGLGGSPALTVCGGTVADLYDPLEKTYGFPLFAIPSFLGPVLGPVIAAYIGPSSLSWRWAEWLSMILCGFVLVVIILFQPETYAPEILKWKAQQLRKATGDDRFLAESEIMGDTFWKKLGIALARPFVLVTSELIIVLMALYFTVMYIILFTFLVGYPTIFQSVYGVSQGITFTIFVAMAIGILLSALLVPIVYHWTKDHLEQRKRAGKTGIAPEQRLWFAMLGGSLSLPISLFWMGWTDFDSISIWSPIIASALFGYGVICVFLCGYMYIIDSYETYAASALTFVALIRYLAAGGMTVVGIPMYHNLGPQYALTIVASIAAVMTPIPYVLYIWGPKVRRFSKYAVNPE